MNKIYLLGILCLFTISTAFPQRFPNVNLYTLDGKIFPSQRYYEVVGKPVVISFWATWCIPCVNELSAINENMKSWLAGAEFEFYAVAVDDSRTSKRVPAFVKGKGWNLTILLDKNQDLKRELNLVNIPYTLILKDGKIIYRRAGYVAGNEDELFSIIKANQ